jgi:hypothetical protein
MKTIPMDQPTPWGGDVTNSRGAQALESYVSIRKYYNTAPESFVVIDRQNVRVTVLPERWNLGPVIAQNSLIISEQVTCNASNKESITVQARKLKNVAHSPVHATALHDWKTQKGAGINFDLKYHNSVLADLVISEGGVVYIAEYDIVVIYGTDSAALANTVEHPFSIAKQTRMSYECIKEVMSHNTGDFTFNVRIVDNTGCIGERWIKLGDEVCRIVPCKDKTIMDGFYVTTRKYAKVGFSDDLRLVSERIPYYCEDNIPFFKLYRSKIDAVNAPTDAAVHEFKLKMLDAKSKANELEGKLRLSENTLLKLEKEKEQLEKSMVFNQAKYLSDMETLNSEKEVLLAKQRTERLKARNEAHSSDRKNITEFIKYVPLILTAFAAVAGVFMKAK